MRVGDFISQKKEQQQPSLSQSKSFAQSVVYSIDPEYEAFQALKRSICSICKKENIKSKNDKRLIKIINKYKDRYPALTPELILEEVEAEEACLPSSVNHQDNNNSSPIGDAIVIPNNNSKQSQQQQQSPSSTAVVAASPPRNNVNESKISALSFSPTKDDSDIGEDEEDVLANTMALVNGTSSPMKNKDNTIGEEEEESSIKEKEPSCWSQFKSECKQNNGYNLYTYTIFLSSLLILMFLISILMTYLNYNTLHPYRDWALAGGITATSAEFRVRGPASDDGKAREFVVSTNANLAIERDQILNVPVSYNDFEPDEHFVKRLSLDSLDPLTPYYYGITRPKRTPNSAVVAGEVGTFVTPSPEGTRMDFTIATGSCALTGSKAEMFKNVLDVNPLMFIHTGDMHYEDSATLDVDERLKAYDLVMGSPSQRLLYMRTIFSYIWDDHDWLGNNEDSDNEEASIVAKQGYTLGIPHYPLGSSSINESTAAKYQAFTIGTVRFILSDLRSESISSSEYYQGNIYSREQKEWLFNEFSQAGNYDFVVWVTSRGWTRPAKLGSDSWGGFETDRDELSAHIASTIGAESRNLMVISGDNHMVAFDDGSSTDFSNQENAPGGFPLFHSGPLTNFGGSLIDFFKPDTFYFTDGCMAYNSDMNHQFSTIDFSFPTREGRRGCMRLRSYSEDASNVIFEKELCGELMEYGTAEQDTCEMKKLSIPTMSLFIAAAGVILITAILALWFLGMKRCDTALSYAGLSIIFYPLTIGAAVAGAYCFGLLGVNMFATSIFITIQAVFGSIFIGMAIYHNNKALSNKKVVHADEQMGIETIYNDPGDRKIEQAKTEEVEDSPTSFPVVLVSKSDAKKSNSASEIIRSRSKQIEEKERNAAILRDLESTSLNKRQESLASEHAVLMSGEADKANSFENNISSVLSGESLSRGVRESMSEAYFRSKKALSPPVLVTPTSTTSTTLVSSMPKRERKVVSDESTIKDEGIELGMNGFPSPQPQPSQVSLVSI